MWGQVSLSSLQKIQSWTQNIPVRFIALMFTQGRGWPCLGCWHICSARTQATSALGRHSDISKRTLCGRWEWIFAVWIILFAWVSCHVNPVSVRMFDDVLLRTMMASASPDPDVLCWNALLSPGDKDHINLSPQINIVQTPSYWSEEEERIRNSVEIRLLFSNQGTCVERKWYDMRIEWSASDNSSCWKLSGGRSGCYTERKTTQIISTAAQLKL